MNTRRGFLSNIVKALVALPVIVKLEVGAFASQTKEFLKKEKTRYSLLPVYGGDSKLNAQEFKLWDKWNQRFVDNTPY